MRRRVREDDDEVRETPPAVVAAVAAGTGALPFLAVYTVMFIVHGSVHPVVPPDVTSTKQGELVVGIVCLVLFVATLVSLLWLLNGRRRWPFVLIQVGLLGTAVDFVLDSTKGGTYISMLVLFTALVAIVTAFHPQAWDHVGRRAPTLFVRLFGGRPAPRPVMPAGSAPTGDATPTSSRFVGRRRSADARKEDASAG
ncbi:MAG TPA: hypothetical protein VHS54_11700 [Jatrophihabitans sp.]|nr:hypothetical protein [Jatrophihabitans sp.]